MDQVYIQIAFQILRILVQLYGQDYQPEQDFLFFLEGERIVLTGNFEDAEKIVLCDNEQYDKCGYRNPQPIIFKGRNQILITISTHPWSFGDRVWYHVVDKHGNSEKGYRFLIGNIYNRVTPITKGFL
jgi:hypothetical protein